MIIKNIKQFFRNIKQYEIDANKKTSLDLILQSANPEASLEDKILWLSELIKWVRATDLLDLEPEKNPNIKLKYFFMVLDHNLDLKQRIQKTFSTTLKELSSIEFFCEVGLPSQSGLFSELSDKVMTSLLPDRPIGNKTSYFLVNLLSEESDIIWLTHLEEGVVEKIIHFATEDGTDYINFHQDLEDSLMYLISNVVSLGLSPEIRKRMPTSAINEMPFNFLHSKFSEYLKTRESSNEEETEIKLKELTFLLNDVNESVEYVYKHLNQFGVSTNIVYQIERIRLSVERIQLLLTIIHNTKESLKRANFFLANLIAQSQTHHDTLAIFSNNMSLLAHKIIENNSQTGEHYIAKDRTEYRSMVKSAMGGGLLTAITVFIKFGLSAIGMNSFFFGLFASFNYAGSFLLIQFSHFTLATKQPASTASSLAEKIEKSTTGENLKEGIEKITDEIVFITRTQIAAIVGNLLAVAPVVALVSYLYRLIVGTPLLSAESSKYVIHSTDIIGPTILYAIFTGFLLFASSICAGWLQNWYSFRELSFLIVNNKKIQFVLGKNGAIKLADMLEHSVGGMAGNISLGFMLGLLPEFLHFIGIPLEARHVTLSTGAFAAAVTSLGFEGINKLEAFRAILGIGAIGLLNLAVSFFLAFTLAIKAKKVSQHKSMRIYVSLAKRFIQSPVSFFIPKSSK